jgi:hypothetical protein
MFLLRAIPHCQRHTDFKYPRGFLRIEICQHFDSCIRFVSYLSANKSLRLVKDCRVVVCLGQLIAPNGRMTVNNELENTLKEAALFKVISRGLLEELREVTKHQRQYDHYPAPQNTNHE